MSPRSEYRSAPPVMVNVLPDPVWRKLVKRNMNNKAAGDRHGLLTAKSEQTDNEMNKQKDRHLDKQTNIYNYTVQSNRQTDRPAHEQKWTNFQ